jgi:hypothetical protein
MKTHELKCWPVYFSAILDGSKTFEFRKNDRGFAVGDTLHLREWAPTAVDSTSVAGEYTGRETRRRVTYVLLGGSFGVAAGYCVLGLEPDAADRGWSLLFVELCEAAGVDPATLEDGPDALHDAIVRMRQDAVRRVEYDDVVDKCESLSRQLGRAEKAWAMWLDRWTHLEDLAFAARERGTGVDLEDAMEIAERAVK